LTEGAEVTIPSQDIDTIVTEYGIADLKGLCLRDRALALINIAHPDFRDKLKSEVMRLGIVPHF
jgi:acyl-CoA hydrolase